MDDAGRCFVSNSGHYRARSARVRFLATCWSRSTGLVANAKALDDLLARRRAGDEVELHLFRRDELMRFRAVLAVAPAERQELKLAARARRQRGGRS